MHRRRAELAEPRVVFAAVVLQRLEQGLAPRGVDPAARQQHPRRMDALFHFTSRAGVDTRHGIEADTQRRGDFEPRAASPELAHLDIVRRHMLAVRVALTLQDVRVVRQALTAGLVIVDDTQVAAARALREDDRRGVADAQVPRRVHR